MVSSPSFKSLIDLLGDRAQKKPENRVFTFLKDGEIESGFLAYQTLDGQARAIAANGTNQKSIVMRSLIFSTPPAQQALPKQW